MKLLILIIFGLICLQFDTHSQNIGIGTSTPVQKLDLNGAIKLGNTAVNSPGTIRWNAVKNDFEGYNGTSWVSLSGGKNGWGDQQSYATESSASNAYLNVHPDDNGKQLGYCIAGNGQWLVAGAYRDLHYSQPNIWDVGSVRLFKYTNNSWVQKYDQSDVDNVASDFFGYSVGMSAFHIIVGAPYANTPFSDQGKAYMFTYSNEGLMSLQATLVASDAGALDYFGSSVAIDGDYAIVGAPGNDLNGSNNVGRAYVYQRNAAQWPQMSVITSPDWAANDNFGSTVAIGNGYLAVAAPYKTINGQTYAGKVYVYKQAFAGWGLIGLLTSPNVNAGEKFGASLCIKDNFLFVGAPDEGFPNNESEGKVYMYGLNLNAVTHQSTFNASDGKTGDGFGKSVSYHNNVLMVGAPTAAVAASGNQGKAYAFTFSSGQWNESAILTGSTNEPGMRFGHSVALVPGFGIAGAPEADLPDAKDNGRIFFFKR